MNHRCCQKEDLSIAEATVKLPLFGRVFEIDEVPVRVCYQCGELFLEESVVRKLILIAQGLELDGKVHGSFIQAMILRNLSPNLYDHKNHPNNY